MTDRSGEESRPLANDPEGEDRLSELLAGWCDGELTSEESVELDRYIERDPSVLIRTHALGKTARRLAELQRGALRIPDEIDHRIREALVARLSEPDHRSDDDRGVRGRWLVGGLASGSARGGTQRSAVVRVLVVAGALLLVVAAVVVAKHVGKSQPPMGAASPPSVGPQHVPAPVSASVPGVAELFSDDFGGVSLDPRKWQTPARPDLLKIDHQALLLSFGPGMSPGNVDDELVPRFDRSFREISFSATVTEAGGTSRGGVSLDLTQGSGRTYHLLFGPTAGILAAPCPNETCTGSADLALPSSQVDLTVGQPFVVRAFDAGDRVRFAIDDHPIVDGQPDRSGLANFALSLTGSAQDAWRVAISNLRVYG